MKLPDQIGQRYGRLTVVARIASGKRGHVRFTCRCDCGKESVVYLCNLRSGDTLSCGCLGRERTAQAHKTHGKKGTRIYRIWCGMRARCENHTNKDWPRYGGRGIAVCDRWAKFETFYSDMGDAPDGLSIDRVDNNGPYSPDNCRWATAETQGRNRRNNTLTEDVVSLTRTMLLYNKSYGAYEVVANDLGIDRSVVSRIANNLVWRNIAPMPI